jgi:hypothetical protein
VPQIVHQDRKFAARNPGSLDPTDTVCAGKSKSTYNALFRMDLQNFVLKQNTKEFSS